MTGTRFVVSAAVIVLLNGASMVVGQEPNPTPAPVAAQAPAAPVALTPEQQTIRRLEQRILQLERQQTQATPPKDGIVTRLEAVEKEIASKCKAVGAKWLWAISSPPGADGSQVQFVGCVQK